MLELLGGDCLAIKQVGLDPANMVKSLEEISIPISAADA
jgi:hypothetical protein